MQIVPFPGSGGHRRRDIGLAASGTCSGTISRMGVIDRPKPKYVKAERVSLREHPSLDERWLQEVIAADPSILRLGEVELIDRERSQGKAGRLDLLFSDTEQSRHYEVELMLGPTDASHIIRTIEYWDIERRRYPAYDHVAVLVAEDVTSRFLNVLSLFSGSIPLIAIQLDALQLDGQVLLNFVRVLDQTELRSDDEEEASARAPVDRRYWEERRGPEILRVMDDVLSFINEAASSPYSLNYTRRFVGLSDGIRARNFVRFFPRKKHVRATVLVDEAEVWAEKLDEAGLDATVNRRGRVAANLHPDELSEHREILRQLLGQAVADYES